MRLQEGDFFFFFCCHRLASHSPRQREGRACSWRFALIAPPPPPIPRSPLDPQRSLFSCYSVAKPRSPTATTFYNPPTSFILLRFLSFYFFLKRIVLIFYLPHRTLSSLAASASESCRYRLQPYRAAIGHGARDPLSYLLLAKEGGEAKR